MRTNTVATPLLVAATIAVSVPFAFCMVTARLTPTADSSITMELWMPRSLNERHHGEPPRRA